MNEELQNKMAEVLGKMAEAVESGGEFATQQAPGLVQEIITWGYVSYSAFAAIGAMMIFGACGLLLLAKKSSDPDVFIPASVFGIVLSVVGIVVFGINFAGVLQVHFTPKLYVLEQIAAMVHSL